MVRGTIASLPKPEQDKVNEAVATIREVMKNLGDYSYMAIALISAEIAE